MLDDFPFTGRHVTKSRLVNRAIDAAAEYIQHALRVSIVHDGRSVPFERPDLFDSFLLARTLKGHGIILSCTGENRFPDEPRLNYWKVHCSGTTNQLAGGAHLTSDEMALRAALSEALERYLWSETDDYLHQPQLATEYEIARRGSYVPIARFAGFSIAQKERSKHFSGKDTKFTWARGVSLVSGKKVYLPAQTLSGSRLIPHEAPLRPRVTTGLATWRDRTGARLRGLLEVIERDAYMILWVNQLTLPRIATSQLKRSDEALAKLFDTCARYHLKVDIVRLITDAPAYSLLAVIRDESGLPPYITIGLKAHQHLARAVSGAISEALRTRVSYRDFYAHGGEWDPNTPPEKIGHYDRLYYWNVPGRAQKLEWMTDGQEQLFERGVWEDDTEAEYLRRIISWCRSKEYECVAASLGISRKNPTSLSIEMVVVPEMQPMHIGEKMQALTGKRLAEVPLLFGYASRSEPFASEPHPFS